MKGSATARKGLRLLMDEVYAPMPYISCCECNTQLMGINKTQVARQAWEEGWAVDGALVYCVDCRSEREDRDLE